MLRQSSIEVKNSKEEVKTVEVGQALDAFNAYTKLGGKEALYMLTYNQLTKQFTYQLPTNVQPARGISKVLNVDIKVGDAVCTVKVGSIAKVLVMNNGLITSISVEALKNLHAVPIKIGFVVEDEKHKKSVEFKPIIKVYDYTFAPVKPEEEVKKRGRPKKVEAKRDQPEEYTLVKLDTKDGSMFVVDGIIMK